MEEEDTNTTESHPQSITVEPEKDKESKKAHPPLNDVLQHHSVISLPKQSLNSPAVQNPAAEKDSEDLVDRDLVLARVETEKRLALIKAWEESAKTKSENKAYKKLSAVGFWEDRKKAYVEAQHKKIEEKMERKKAEYAEKMKNKMAEIHQWAEEKRALIEAQKQQEFLKVEDTAAKFRSRGYNPKRILECFSV